MSAYPIRAFTAEGLKRFSDYLEKRTDDERRTAAPPPVELLHDAKYAADLHVGKLSKNVFETKFDLAMSVAGNVGTDNLTKMLAEPNVWPWLSLFFWRSTFPFEKGHYIIGARSRHIVEKIAGRNQDHSHRHLVRGGVVAVHRFGPHARVLLGKASEQTKMEEQVMSRTAELGLAGSTEFVRLLHRLYWDPKKNAVRKGAKGQGKGSIMRVIEIMHHLDVTFDVQSLGAEQIEQLLPQPEFKVAA
ncbi:hypothetical protein OK349_03835 [Sphingomonas sp. BT-65]|uniref:hypothetical protein n=1 Tax=Sphingomonas sp. BT-65 TaxID=2989821 RepID=UPI00223679C8|nr:hypothetical protein [Sphingomonas sp. BT-65]MCW4460824.1 hypothetical protein [Sphingomonas sp. BT-65]